MIFQKHLFLLTLIFSLSKANFTSQDLRNYIGNGTFIAVQIDKYGTNDTYKYNIPDDFGTNSSNDNSSYDYNAFQQQLPSRRKDYPPMIHCKDVINYCWTVCVFRLKAVCKDWNFLCEYGDFKFNINKRCKQECVKQYTNLIKKYPIPPKLHRDKAGRFFNPHAVPRFSDSEYYD